MDLNLLKTTLIVAVASSIITTALVQKIKEGLNFKNSKKIIFVSFGISMIIGTLFSLTFSELNVIYSLWVGLVSFIGADAIYKAFEDKIFKKFSDLEKVTNISDEDFK